MIGHSNPPFPTLGPKRVMSAKMNVLKGSEVQILFMLIVKRVMLVSWSKRQDLVGVILFSE